MDGSTAAVAILAILVFVAIVVAVVVSIAVFVFSVWAIVDACRYTEAEYAQAQQNKMLWLVALVVSWFVGAPFIAALVYVLWARPALRKAQQVSPSPVSPVDTVGTVPASGDRGVSKTTYDDDPTV